ncbi:protein kinase [Streptomyces sp. NPDC005438]|uniref:protein kinase domain-containing protein n=1 Tax=Streptomyces sp. NPDC005438 TaxID=3156880 RepID=UPI0033BEC021
MEPLSPEDPGRIGRYRLLGRLGGGGMGRVYLARSEGGRTVAVKLVRPELAQQEEFRARFAQEVAAARRVGGRWTAPVLDADTEATTPWVATGYIAGPSLTEVVHQRYGPLPPESVRALATGLVNALAAIHEAGLIHRDLKPSNILITIDGPKVIDFGIARALDALATSELTRTGAVIGSPGFMSPEQVRGEPVTPASDVFSLGSVLAYAATGRPPFRAPSGGSHAQMFRVVGEEPDLEGLDGPLRRLVEDCLRKDPGQRPTVDELLGVPGPSLTPTWLPPKVLAQLGRHAADLLDLDTATGGAEAPGAEPATGGFPLARPRTVVVPSRGAASGEAPTRGGPHQGVTVLPVPPSRASRPPAAAPVHPRWRTVPAPRRQLAPVPEAARRPLLDWTLAAATSALLLTVGALLLREASSLHQLTDRITAQGLAGPASLPPLRADTDDARHGLLYAHLGAALAWLAWFWRAHVVARWLEPTQLRVAPVWAVPSWLVPGLNLVVPKVIANDVWWISARRPRDRAHHQRYAFLLSAWWLAALSYLVLNTGWDEYWYEQNSVEVARSWLGTQILCDLVGAVAALLGAAYVLRLTRLQQERLNERPIAPPTSG